MRTSLCLRFKSEVIAAGAISLAARACIVPLPEEPAWYLLFDANKEEIAQVEQAITHLYTLPKAKYMHLLHAKSDARFRYSHPLINSKMDASF